VVTIARGAVTATARPARAHVAGQGEGAGCGGVCARLAEPQAARTKSGRMRSVRMINCAV